MATFSYKAIDHTGQVIEAEENGDSAESLVKKLAGMRLSVIEIKPKKQSSSFSLKKIGSFFQRVSGKELKYFYVNLATLINAGCTLKTSIAALSEQSDNKFFQKVLLEIDKDITSGKALSDSLAKHPRVFNQLFITLVKSGEEGGMLDQILLRYAVYVENQEKIKSRIRGAMVLPGIISIVAVGVVIGLLTYVFPTFMQMFAGKEHLLPAPTKFVIKVSDILRFSYHWIFAAIISLSMAFYMILQTKLGWRIFCIVQLRMPLFGVLFRKVYLARFAQTLGALIKSGVPTLRAIHTTGETIPNVIVTDALRVISSCVERGGTMTSEMHNYPLLFPNMVTLMISVGESTGTIDAMLEKVGSYFEAEVQEAISAILSAIEPIMTVIMGVVVLVLALSMFLPLFDIGKTFS